MQFDVETPLKGYKGTVGGVNFVDGRARVGSDQKAELGYFRRHGYKITPVEEPEREPADADTPGGPDPEPAGPDGNTTETPEDQGEQPDPEGKTGQTAAEAAAQLQGTPFEPASGGTGDGFDASALGEATAAAAATTAPPTTGTGTDSGAGEQPRRPAKNAPVAAWATYAKQLGATDEELGGKTKNELVELVTQYEQKGAGQ